MKTETNLCTIADWIRAEYDQDLDGDLYAPVPASFRNPRKIYGGNYVFVESLVLTDAVNGNDGLGGRLLANIIEYGTKQEMEDDMAFPCKGPETFVLASVPSVTNPLAKAIAEEMKKPERALTEYEVKGELRFPFTLKVRAESYDEAVRTAEKNFKGTLLSAGGEDTDRIPGFGQEDPWRGYFKKTNKTQ